MERDGDGDKEDSKVTEKGKQQDEESCLGSLEQLQDMGLAGLTAVIAGVRSF